MILTRGLGLGGPLVTQGLGFGFGVLGAVVDFIREWWLILRGRVVSYKLRDDITITLEPNLATVSAEAPTHDILIDESQSLTATQAEASTEELWVKT